MFGGVCERAGKWLSVLKIMYTREEKTEIIIFKENSQNHTFKIEHRRAHYLDELL